MDEKDGKRLRVEDTLAQPVGTPNPPDRGSAEGPLPAGALDNEPGDGPAVLHTVEQWVPKREGGPGWVDVTGKAYIGGGEAWAKTLRAEVLSMLDHNQSSRRFVFDNAHFWLKRPDMLAAEAVAGEHEHATGAAPKGRGDFGAHRERIRADWEALNAGIGMPHEFGQTVVLRDEFHVRDDSDIPLRDWFAASALTALVPIINGTSPKGMSLKEAAEETARRAYVLADAMLAARGVTAEPPAELRGAKGVTFYVERSPDRIPHTWAPVNPEFWPQAVREATMTGFRGVMIVHEHRYRITDVPPA